MNKEKKEPEEKKVEKKGKYEQPESTRFGEKDSEKKYGGV